MNQQYLMSRRRMLRQAGAASAILAVSGEFAPLLASDRRFKIGACDWSIGKMADPAALEVAREISLDGVQISLGTKANDMHLRQPAMQEKYRAAAAKTGVEVASVAIGELNNTPYKSDPQTISWVADSIAAAKALGTRVVLLAFFSANDLRGDEAGTREVVRRLKTIAPSAEKAGVILGIESWLSAEQHLEIIEQVGSKAVQVYYDVCNSNDRGYDIYREIRLLGRERICEFHAKENGTLLGQGKVDFQKVREALDAIEYRGWIQIEGAVPPGKEMLESYRANVQFLRRTLS